MAFTEFYCQTTGDNLNAGSTNADAAAFTYAGGTFVRATGVFTVASGDPASDGVAVGDFASIYTTAGATVATFIARVTARDATTITVSLTAISGATSTVSETAAAATCKIGGAWKGPNGAVSFPFGFVLNTLRNAAGDSARVNFKNGTDYAITAAMTHSAAGDITWMGYTSTVGDGGRAVIANVTTTASYLMLNYSGTNANIIDFIFDASVFTTGTSQGVVISGVENMIKRCVVRSARGFGLSLTGAGSTAVECEAHSNNRSNTANTGGFNSDNGNITFVRCISHDNTGSNTSGFQVSASTTLIQCIADTNGGRGVSGATATSLIAIMCDFYNNTGDGLYLSAASGVILFAENCNFVKNGGYGINHANATRSGAITNCGFGSGTQANTSGNIISAIGSIETSGTVTYAADVTPWVDPASGDFRISLTAAKGTGRGSFTQTAASYSGTVAYPDIGAAHHVDSGGSGGTVNLMCGKL